MIQRLMLVDQPYVSDLLRDSIQRNRLPVVLTEAARTLGFSPADHMVEQDEAIRLARNADRLLVYTSSENSIEWIARHLPFTPLPEVIRAFKDKARFRTLTRSLYPDLFFKKLGLDDLADLALSDLPESFIIKPNVGFFSMGVHKVTDRRHWDRARRDIQAKARIASGLYPPEVLDTASLILEECIPGDEFAVDAYFDADGDPVVLNIWKRMFASKDDTGDRVYTTSKRIIETHMEAFGRCLAEIGALTGAVDIPVHAELRRDSSGKVVPIEINPMRFGGWCTTGDMTLHAYGFDPHVYFLDQKRPHWPEILKDRDGVQYSLIVLDNSTGVDHRRIAAFDYDRLLGWFKKPRDLRKTAFNRYPVFGFLFVETPEGDTGELDRILGSDLTEFIEVEP